MASFKRDDEQRPAAGLPKQGEGLFDDEAEVKEADPAAILAEKRRRGEVEAANKQVVADKATTEEDDRRKQLIALAEKMGIPESIANEVADDISKGVADCGCF